jgi:response regulator RpfG family c-di-GMP phosphodiesterase
MAVTDKQAFTHLAQELGRYPVDIRWADTGNTVLDLLTQAGDQGGTVDLVITDETLADMTGRDLVEQVIMKSPVTNCAAASALSPDRFHEVYEGLGVLMQLPLTPDAESGKELVRILKKLNILRALP